MPYILFTYIFNTFFNRISFFLSPEVLHRIAAYLCLVPPLSDTDLQTSYSPSFLLEILVSHHQRRPSQLEELNSMPLYPTETVLWDESFVPNEYFEGEGTNELYLLYMILCMK